MTRLPGVLAAALALTLPVTASALDLGPRDLHLRAGLGIDPDQVRLGAQATLGPSRRLVFRPSLDLGLGNGVRMATLNGDILYRPRRTGGRLEPFLGAGPALSLVDVTDGVGEADGVSAGLAGHLVGGVSVLPSRRRGGTRYQLEARAGFGETPDFALMLAIAF